MGRGTHLGVKPLAVTLMQCPWWTVLTASSAHRNSPAHRPELPHVLDELAPDVRRSQEHRCILSHYRGSFDGSFRLSGASCAGLWSPPYFVASPLTCTFSLALVRGIAVSSKLPQGCLDPFSHTLQNIFLPLATVVAR